MLRSQKVKISVNSNKVAVDSGNEILYYDFIPQLNKTKSVMKRVDLNIFSSEPGQSGSPAVKYQIEAHFG